LLVFIYLKTYQKLHLFTYKVMLVLRVHCHNNNYGKYGLILLVQNTQVACRKWSHSYSDKTDAVSAKQLLISN